VFSARETFSSISRSKNSFTTSNAFTRVTTGGHYRLIGCGPTGGLALTRVRRFICTASHVALSTMRRWGAGERRCLAGGLGRDSRLPVDGSLTSSLCSNRSHRHKARSSSHGSKARGTIRSDLRRICRFGRQTSIGHKSRHGASIQFPRFSPEGPRCSHYVSMDSRVATQGRYA
jgi:hypothetical protein